MKGKYIFGHFKVRNSQEKTCSISFVYVWDFVVSENISSRYGRLLSFSHSTAVAFKQRSITVLLLLTWRCLFSCSISCESVTPAATWCLYISALPASCLIHHFPHKPYNAGKYLCAWMLSLLVGSLWLLSAVLVKPLWLCVHTEPDGFGGGVRIS